MDVWVITTPDHERCSLKHAPSGILDLVTEPKETPLGVWARLDISERGVGSKFVDLLKRCHLEHGPLKLRKRRAVVKPPAIRVLFTFSSSVECILSDDQGPMSWSCRYCFGFFMVFLLHPWSQHYKSSPRSLFLCQFYNNWTQKTKGAYIQRRYISNLHY